jgi:hypothetical protein
MGGGYAAHFGRGGDDATLEDRTQGKTRRSAGPDQ